MLKADNRGAKVRKSVRNHQINKEKKTLNAEKALFLHSEHILLAMINNQDSQQAAPKEPIVTFIVAVYNLPVHLLCRCIDSIIALSLRHYEREIIIVDDGSEVSPMNSLMQYADDIVYVRQRNQGLSVARNKGLELATGRFVQFVDADDYLLTVPYEHCLDMVRYTAGLDMLLFDFTRRDTQQVAFTDSALTSGTDYMRSNNIRGTACGYLFRRSILGSLRFTPGIWHEDEEFTPQLLLRAEHVCSTDAKAYFYYSRSGSITTEGTRESKERRLDDQRHVIDSLRLLADRVPHDERIALQRRIAQLTMDYIYQTIIQMRSRKVLDQRLEELRAAGLFPLPDRDYTTKYKWFRRMTNSKTGLSLMLRLLPLLKTER